MRLAVATDDGEHVAAHTGRCRGVVVFEVHESTARRIEERSSGFPLHARGECHGREGAGRDEHDGSQETPAEPQDAQGGNRGCGHRNPQGENRH